MPFMATGQGVELIGGWFGIGPDRGIALVFVLTGIVGLAVAAVALHSRPCRELSARYSGRPELALATC
jgi:MFS transporter, DHA3 family, multidrug efflux protein